jgi:hypothetical protein
MRVARTGQPLPRRIIFGASLDLGCDSRRNNESFRQLRQERKLADLSQNDER